MLSLCALLSLALLELGASRDEAIVIRVDPRVPPARATADSPAIVPTLRAAFDLAKRISRDENSFLLKEFQIELAPGRHFLDDTLVLTPEDTNERIASIRVVGAHYRPTSAREREPFPGVGSLLSGGRKIEGLHAADWHGHAAWRAELPAARGGAWPFRELFVNGERRTRARHPNHGYLSVAGLVESDAAKPWNEKVASFRFNAGDLDPLRSSPDADVTVMSRWVESHCRIASIDFDTRTVALRDPTVFKLDPGDPFYLDGASAFLDEPGEWWLDEAEGRLWYLPLPGEEIETADVVAPRLERLLSIEGRPLQREWVQHVRFEGVGFAHAEWWFPPEGDRAGSRASGFAQAAYGVPAAIEVVGGKYLDFLGCEVEHVGTYGIGFGVGCSDNVVGECRFTDLGAGGVKIGETTLRSDPREICERHDLRGCEISDGGRLFHSAVGVWIGQAPRNVVLGNEIRDFYYTGISIGWTWGYGEARGGGQLVVGNDVLHIGQRADGDGPILSDMGAIYTLGDQTGTRIENNRFTDVAALRYGGWGIYFDEGTSHAVARRNLAARTTHGGFHQHYGKENLVEGNVFAFGRDAQVQRSRPEPHTSFTFRRNVVLWDHGELFAGDLGDGHFVFEDNLYWREGGEIRFAGRGFAEWQAAGFDRGSHIVAPGFVDAHGDDWRLVEGAAACALLPDLAPSCPHEWAFDSKETGPMPTSRR